MVSRLLTLVSAFILSVISAGGYLGIVLLMAIESACIPLPSEIIMPFSGYLAGQGRFNLWWVGVAGALGCNLGSIVAYWVGAAGGRPLLERYGRYLLISRRDLEWADRWFAGYGEATVFFSRLLPIIRTFIALPAGIARMNFLRFNLYTFLGSLPWCLGLAYLGFKFGEHWQETIRPYFEKFDVVIGLVILLALVWFIANRWRELRSPRPSAGS
ncbi:MAG: DedA family protein [Terriglobia bacterium]